MQNLKDQVQAWKRNLAHVSWVAQHGELYQFPEELAGLKQELQEYTEKMMVYYSRAVESYSSFCEQIDYNPLQARYGCVRRNKGKIGVSDIRGALIEVEGEYFPIGFLEEMQVDRSLMEDGFNRWKNRILQDYGEASKFVTTWPEKEKETMKARKNGTAASFVKGAAALFLFGVSLMYGLSFWNGVRQGVPHAGLVMILAVAGTVLALLGVCRAVHELYLYYKVKCLDAHTKKINEAGTRINERVRELKTMTYPEFYQKWPAFPAEDFVAYMEKKIPLYRQMVYLYKGKTRVITGKKEFIFALVLMVFMANIV